MNGVKPLGKHTHCDNTYDKYGKKHNFAQFFLDTTMSQSQPGIGKRMSANSNYFLIREV